MNLTLDGGNENVLTPGRFLGTLRGVISHLLTGRATGVRLATKTCFTGTKIMVEVRI